MSSPARSPIDADDPHPPTRLGVPRLPQLIPLHRLPDLIPSSRDGKRLAMATIYRWVLRGRLSTMKVGGSRYVTMEALADFMNPTSVGVAPVASCEAPRSPHRDAVAAGAALDRLIVGRKSRLPQRLPGGRRRESDRSCGEIQAIVPDLTISDHAHVRSHPPPIAS